MTEQKGGDEMRRALLLLLCAALALGLTGCAEQLTERPPAEMPLPDIVVPYNAPTNDSVADRTLPAVLHYLNQDGTRLRTGAVRVQVRGTESMAEAALRALFVDQVPDGLYPVATGVALSREVPQPVTVSCGVATVSLSAPAKQLSSKAFYAVRMAVANTLTELPGISYVNVLIDGRERGLDSAATMPIGTMTRQAAGDIDTAWRQLEVQQDQIGSQGFARAVTLYLPTADGALILPQVQSLTFASALPATLIADVVDALSTGGSAVGVPNLLDFVVGEPELIEEDKAIGPVIRLTVLPTLEQALQQSGLPKGTLCALLTQTLVRFVPGAQGFQLRVGTELVQILAAEETPNGQSMEFDGGVMRPEDFAAYNGAVCRVPLPRQDAQRLVWVERVLPATQEALPRARLRQLLLGPTATETAAGLTAAVPGTGSEYDIQAVQFIDDVALVRFSAAFAQRCAELPAEQERNLVYAIVNLLTEFPQVQRVAFFVEGEQVRTLSGTLEMRGFFWRNPGLM